MAAEPREKHLEYETDAYKNSTQVDSWEAETHSGLMSVTTREGWSV